MLTLIYRLNLNTHHPVLCIIQWNMVYRECLTTFAPILISLSRSVVNDQCLMLLGNANRLRKLPRLYARANN